MTLQVLQVSVSGSIMLLVFGFIFLITMLAQVAIAFLVYRDATGHNSDHALAWGLGAFLGGLVVWVLYFVVRDEIGTESAM